MLSKKFNIMLISWHDLGKHLNCYGRKDAFSPNLDKLAEEGLKCDTFFSTSPMCSPARGSMLTGRWPHVNGLQALINRGWDLPREEKTMGNYLKEAGYHTRLFGFQHERCNPDDFDFDEMWLESTYCDDVTDAVNGFLENRLPDDEPFFARIGFQQVHRPWKYPAGDSSKVEPLPYLPDSEPIRRQLTQLNGSIKHADHCVGQILEQLKKTGLEQNTLVIFTTDHGIGFPRAKCTLYDPGLESALIMKLPGIIKPNISSKQLLSNVDLLPTVLELADIKTDISNINGKSFASLCDGADNKINDMIFGERSWGDGYEPKRCVRTSRYKYILNFECMAKISSFGGGEDILGDDILKYLTPGYSNPEAPEELYNLEDDPYEQNNLIRTSGIMPVLNKMRNNLKKWMQETNDPLLKGPVASPNYEYIISSIFENDLPDKALHWNRNLIEVKHKPIK